jgi:tRNA(Ile)-lysidine synthase
MLERFLKYIEDHNLFASGDSILIGVSGGVDSVVLLDLFYKAGYPIGIAHCNFKLRGEESDQDEEFVEKFALKYSLPFYNISFHTAEYAEENGISIEMAARELRYRWFEEIRSGYNYNWISVAHHRDDQLETFFLNLTRGGTGLSGLTGMNPINNKIVRPLLFASRKEIEAYATENHLEFREDGSNRNTEFTRNKIRHQVLPLMEQLNPSFREGLTRTIENLKNSRKIENAEIRNAWDRIAEPIEDDIYFSIEELKNLDPLPTYLFHFLKDYNFNTEVVNDIVSTLVNGPGKQFYSSTHRLIRDRENLILRELKTETQAIHYLDESCGELSYPVKMRISIIEKKYKFEIPDTQRIGCVDLEKIQFPLIIRHWQKGDFFHPLGMKGEKKLSDFFIDAKMSLPEKENTWILANGDDIVWVIGRRLDDRFKITPKTKNIYRMELI